MAIQSVAADSREIVVNQSDCLSDSRFSNGGAAREYPRAAQPAPDRPDFSAKLRASIPAFLQLGPELKHLTVRAIGEATAILTVERRTGREAQTGAADVVRLWRRPEVQGTAAAKTAVPVFADEVFSKPVTAISVSDSGSLIAVGTRGGLRLFRIERSLEDMRQSRLSHVADYEVPGECSVTVLAFSRKAARLSVSTDTGYQTQIRLGGKPTTAMAA